MIHIMPPPTKPESSGSLRDSRSGILHQSQKDKVKTLQQKVVTNESIPGGETNKEYLPTDPPEIKDMEPKDPHSSYLNKDIQHRENSPDYQEFNFSDTELYMNNSKFRMTKSRGQNRGGGFKTQILVANEQTGVDQGGHDLLNTKVKTKGFKQIDIKNRNDQVINGSNFSYFCPKRFNRYPRFTIFFKKERQDG